MTAMKWLSAATEKILFGPDRAAVRRELADHIQDRQEALLAQNPELTPAQAEEQAVAAMGDPAPLAQELARLHRPWWGYLWRASQALLILCALALGLAALLRVGNNPGPYVWEYMTWYPAGRSQTWGETLLSHAVYRPEAGIETGGYTVTVESATLDTVARDSLRVLSLDLDIRCGWRSEAMNLSWALPRITDSTGAVYTLGYTQGGQPEWSWTGTALWGDLAPLGQRALVTLRNVPEGAQWVELTFGRGELAAALRVDLTKEAAA